jgi:hypothetical protein
MITVKGRVKQKLKALTWENNYFMKRIQRRKKKKTSVTVLDI